MISSEKEKKKVRVEVEVPGINKEVHFRDEENFVIPELPTNIERIESGKKGSKSKFTLNSHRSEHF